MRLTENQITKIVDAVAARFGISGFVSADNPANEAPAWRVQVLGTPYSFRLKIDVTEEEVRAKAEEEFRRADSGTVV